MPPIPWEILSGPEAPPPIPAIVISTLFNGWIGILSSEFTHLFCGPLWLQQRAFSTLQPAKELFFCHFLLQSPQYASFFAAESSQQCKILRKGELVAYSFLRIHNQVKAISPLSVPFHYPTNSEFVYIYDDSQSVTGGCLGRKVIQMKLHTSLPFTNTWTESFFLS